MPATSIRSPAASGERLTVGYTPWPGGGRFMITYDLKSTGVVPK